MKNFSRIFTSFLLISFSFLFPLNAKEVVVTSTEGESFIIEVDSETPFFEVVELIQCYTGDAKYILEENSLKENEGLSFSYTVGFPGISVRKAKYKGPRKYEALVTANEKENIRFIIRSLARHNWSQLAKEESSLKKTGDKINHIHPLRFLQAVFTDEELKVGLYVIRNKSLVWGEYYDGLKKSLNEESDLNNLAQFIPDFANNLGLDVADVLPYTQSRQWSGLIDLLIQRLPRDGNPNRYDM